MDERYNELLRDYRSLLVHCVELENQIIAKDTTINYWYRRYDKDVDKSKNNLVA